MIMKIYYTIGSFVLIAAFVLVNYAAYYIFYPFKTANVEQPIRVVNKDALFPGGNLVLRYKYAKYNSYTAVTSRKFECTDGSVYPLTDKVNNLEPTGGKWREITVSTTVIPKNIVIGVPCKFIMTNDYQINPLRVIQKTFYTENFIVM